MRGSPDSWSLTPPSAVQVLIEQLRNLKDQHCGRNGIPGDEANFIPWSSLEQFWERPNIFAAIQSSGPPLNADPNDIRVHSLRFFSLLVFIGRVEVYDEFSKHSFDDGRFPLTTATGQEKWINTPLYKRVFEDILEWQWVFFPFTFNSHELRNNRILEPRMVLPIVTQKVIKNGEDATVYKICLHPSCNMGANSTLVRKTYKGEPGRRLFHRELEAFSSLRHHPSDNIVACHGSFMQVQSDKSVECSLILEFVDGGDLQSFYQTTDPPKTRKDVNMFWKSYLGVFEGLYHLRSYHADPSNTGSEHLIVHQDIKPENLLLAKGPSGSKYDFTLKLADFGLNGMAPVDSENNNPMVLDTHGGPTYGAPECSHHSLHTIPGRNYITADADTWSMGAVTSDVGTWVVLGKDGREKYHQLRVHEVERRSSFRNTGHAGCFHNGHDKLMAVGEMHKRVQLAACSFDTITSKVLQVAENHMLRSVAQRHHPSQLTEMFSDILDAAFSESDSRSAQSTPSSTTSKLPSVFEPTSPDGLSPTSPPPRAPVIIPMPSEPSDDSRNPLRPAPRLSAVYGLTWERAREYYNKKKRGWTPDSRVEHMIHILKKNLHRRDHMFFIDVSPSMKEYSEQVAEALQVLGYIAKQVDSDDLELCFSSDPTRIYKEAHTTPLVAKLGKQEWTCDNFEDKITTFVDDVVIPRLPSRFGKSIKGRLMPASLGQKPLSIFVFTDGCWGNDPSKACGIENPISALVEKIVNRELGRTQVMVQFIRFGDDKAGIRHLKYLDDFGKKYVNRYGKEYNCDVVDTKPVHSNVGAMFYGAVDLTSDRLGEQFGPPLCGNP